MLNKGNNFLFILRVLGSNRKQKKFYSLVVCFTYSNSFDLKLVIFRMFIVVQKSNSQLWYVMSCQ